jgi:hypothetical protein
MPQTFSPHIARRIRNLRVRQVRKGHPLPVKRMAQFLEQWIITQAVPAKEFLARYSLIYTIHYSSTVGV